MASSLRPSFSHQLKVIGRLIVVSLGHYVGASQMSFVEIIRTSIAALHWARSYALFASEHHICMEVSVTSLLFFETDYIGVDGVKVNSEIERFGCYHQEDRQVESIRTIPSRFA